MNNLRFTPRELTLTALFTALTAILAQFYIPLVPIVFSFGIFGAFLAASILPTKLSVTSQVVYVLLGAVGVPVFSGFGSGLQRVLGPNGGYLIGYIFIALVMGVLRSRSRDASYLEMLLISFCGLAACYFCAALWLGISLGYNVKEAIVVGVLPFLPMDSIKIATSAAIGLRVRKALTRARLLA